MPWLDEEDEGVFGGTGWLVYPYPPAFWRRQTVRALHPDLSYFGPLPQRQSTLLEIVECSSYPVYVYVIQDDEGEVLYVGKTINPVGRLTTHRVQKDWWPDRGQLTLLGIEAGSRIEADAFGFRLESLAIKELQPLYNVAGVVR